MMHWFTGARRISRDDITRWNPAPLSRTSCPCVRWGTPHRRLNLRCYSAPQVFQHPNPCCCCKTGTSRQDGFAPHAGRGPARTPAAARTDPIRAHTKPARGAPRGRTGPPLPAPPGGGPAVAEGPLPQARRPLPRGRVPGPPLRSPGGATKASPRRPAPSRRWGVTYRSAALAGRRGGSHSAGAGEGVAVTDGRRRAEAEPHRCPHRTAPSSPPVALRPLAAPVQPGRWPPLQRRCRRTSGQGGVTRCRAAPLPSGASETPRPSPPPNPPAARGAGREAAVGTGVAGAASWLCGALQWGDAVQRTGLQQPKGPWREAGTLWPSQAWSFPGLLFFLSVRLFPVEVHLKMTLGELPADPTSCGCCTSATPQSHTHTAACWHSPRLPVPLNPAPDTAALIPSHSLAAPSSCERSCFPWSWWDR